MVLEAMALLQWTQEEQVLAGVHRYSKGDEKNRVKEIILFSIFCFNYRQF